MKKIKKMLFLALGAMMAVSLTACGPMIRGGGNNSNDDDEDDVTAGGVVLRYIIPPVALVKKPTINYRRIIRLLPELA